MTNYKVEGNQITFSDNRFYEQSGQFVPSVTTILQAYPKDASFYKWLKDVGNDADAIRDAAGDRGSTVHHLTEQIDQGLQVNLLDELGRQQFSLTEWAMLARYVEFRQRFPFTILQSELNLIGLELGEAGTLDRYVDWDGKKYILDIKTSNSIWPHYWLQLAAYKRLFETISGQQIDGVGILWLNAKTRTNGTKGAIQGNGWQVLLKEDTTADLKLYDATKLLWHAQNEGLQPKQLTYSLTQSLSNATA